MSEPLITFRDVWKTYGEGEARVDALAGVDLVNDQIVVRVVDDIDVAVAAERFDLGS